MPGGSKHLGLEVLGGVGSLSIDVVFFPNRFASTSLKEASFSRSPATRDPFDIGFDFGGS